MTDCNGYAGESMPDDITQDDVRDDYDSGALAKCSKELRDATESEECPDCGESVKGSKCPNCKHCFDNGDSPVFTIVLDCGIGNKRGREA